jgi:hypothetical protein
MEIKNTVGVYRLCVIVFFFVASMLFLNNQKKTNSLATHIDAFNSTASHESSVSLDQMYHYINSLMASRDINLIIKVINHSMNHHAVDIVEKIILDNRCVCSSIDKMRIIFGVMVHQSSKKMVQYRLLDFLLNYPAIFDTHLVLLTLMRSGYADGLPVFLSWLKDRQKDSGREHVRALFIDHALAMAIDQNDYGIIETMFSKKIKISSDKASKLLLSVVEQNKDTAFIHLLVRHARADINYVKNGKTLLMMAVEQSNEKIVQALLEEGAVVDRIIDPINGTALTCAVASNNKAIEQLLREYGA